MPASSHVTETCADATPILAELKAALLVKDARIESLERENHRLRERLALAGLDDPAARLATGLEKSVAPVRHEIEPRPAPPEPAPAKYNWDVPLKADFVRLAGPAEGVYPDRWAGPRIGIAFLSERPLAEITLSIWFKPIEGERSANLTMRIDGAEVHRASVRISEKTEPITIAFAVDIAAHTVFELRIECDHRARTELPERRALCYVIRSIGFA